MRLLEIVELTKYFSGLPALSDVSFSVSKGDITGLIGPNGSGKTTLFNVVSGFYKPTRGRVKFDGKEITGYKPNQTAKMGLVRTFQETSLWNSETVDENMRRGYYLLKGGGFFHQLLNTPSAEKKIEEIQERARELIEYFGLAKWRSYIVGNLPHGVKRLLGIAIAVSMKPTLLMLDEPVTGMNPEETRETINLIKGLREQGLSLLIVEHNMRAIMSACNKIVVLNAGVKIAEGLPQEIRNNEEVIKAYLGERSNAFRG